MSRAPAEILAEEYREGLRKGKFLVLQTLLLHCYVMYKALRKEKK